MTQRDFYTKALTMVADKEMVEFINAELAKIDTKNEKAKAKRMENAKANEPILEEITKYLTNHKSALASELASACEISTPKAVAMCNKLVEVGTISVKEVSIPKVGKRKSYSLIVE